jgi:uncharacterized protein
VAITNQLSTPVSGVRLENGLLKNVFDNNIAYLLNNFPVDDLLYVFRERAGRSSIPGQPFNWDKGGPMVIGSVAGLYLMGTGNALRWQDHAELRSRMNQVVAGIDDCKQSNGFIMAYKEQDTSVRENANYVRSWLTHGLIDAAGAGNARALPLIRGHLDWFNHCEYIDRVVDNKKGYIAEHWIPYQGMISSTRMYLSPLGKKDDLDLVLKHYQEDWWLDQLVADDNHAIYDRPESHCYEITAFEAYLDLYRITGDKRYLEAVFNAWHMLKDNWQMPGGSWALCERRRYPPKSYQLGQHSRSGELCCAVFWIKLNQRLHLLFPEEESFVNEMEKSIFNAAIGNQMDSTGICYHNVMHGVKDKPAIPPQGTCCEGQGVRLYGSLPEYLYSLSSDGIYIDLYAPSVVSWTHKGQKIGLRDETRFPFEDTVKLTISVKQPCDMTVSLRIPSWTIGPAAVYVNGTYHCAGIPGSYCHVNRTWSDGDVITFAFARKLTLSRYEGYDQIPGKQRYCLEYGPILLVLAGKFNMDNCIRILNDPGNPESWLMPVKDKPLHYRISIEKGYWELREDEAWSGRYFEFMPYWDIPVDQEFTAFPVMQ